ncbi:MAG: hypothetical protein PHH47_10125 [Gallionella sp.]|nr:hypothetical protein [Gallionella sp.]MDD4946457.1 hypothetical protein [Gallionella sp.]
MNEYVFLMIAGLLLVAILLAVIAVLVQMDGEGRGRKVAEWLFIAAFALVVVDTVIVLAVM